MTVDKRIIDEQKKILDRKIIHQKNKEDSYKFALSQKDYIKEIVKKYKFKVDLETINDDHTIKVRDSLGGRGAEIVFYKSLERNYLTVSDGRHYFVFKEFDRSEEEIRAFGKIANKALLRKGLEAMIVEVRARYPQPKIPKYMVVFIVFVLLSFFLLANFT
ncbi:hypothetical protein [Sulfitobacter dubius]|uniref:hypothetical protein n=1 Tax=Sulfitobacter dubius TaxID=218673 RepID=UPI0022AFD7C4|nr:hypothetical protein [Sulfitobacter dubius]MCZ4368684.1 hypothetical protein [Sulfitobacter dubius]